MKIMTGMGSIDDYQEYVNAGADEIFIGYVPQSWMLAHGRKYPLNRREVIYYNVQIGSDSELMILRDMVKELKVPVTITLNSLRYKAEDYDEILEIVKGCSSLGFSRFIIADGDFLSYLDKKEIDNLEICLSGEYGEINPEILEYKNMKRVIFPRQTTIEEMEYFNKVSPSMEKEAFVLNEKCQFTGAYCNSLHCDEFCHLCRVPYDLSPEVDSKYEDKDLPYDTLGLSGCGLCSLWKLKQAGVSHLKLVSRGNNTEDTIRDIKALKKALRILEESSDEKSFISTMKKELFPHGCSNNCYYYLSES